MEKTVFPALAKTGDPNGPRGLTGNEIAGALISMMARSRKLQNEAGYIDARPLSARSKIPLATHGRTIHWVISGRPQPEQNTADLHSGADISKRWADVAEGPVAVVI